MLVYLVGAMENAPDDGIKWRRRFAKELGKLNIECIIPNDKEKEILKNIDIKKLKKDDIDKYIEIIRKFISMDLKFVEKVDAIICYWDGTYSSGTIHEVGYAYQLKKPTYLVSSVDEVDIPGWFLSCFTKRFYSLKHLIEHLKED